MAASAEGNDEAVNGGNPLGANQFRRLIADLSGPEETARSAAQALYQVLVHGSMDEALRVRDELLLVESGGQPTRMQQLMLDAARRRVKDPLAPPLHRMPRLPVPPTFPVYGLPCSWTGSRRLGSWGLAGGGMDAERARRYGYANINLDHEQELERGVGLVLVSSMPPKLVHVFNGTTTVATDAEAMSEAAMRGQVHLINIVHIAPPHQPERRAWFTTQVHEADRLSRDLASPPWTRHEGRVDGQVASFAVRHLGPGWTAVTSTPAARIAVSAVHQPLTVLELVTVDPGAYGRGFSAI